MESRANVVERGARKNKRKWTEDENEKLIESLLILMNSGSYRAHNGFKLGYLGFLESSLDTKLPNSGMKGKSHIESRLKTLKKDFTVVYDLRYGSTSGFGWDPESQVITVLKDVWDSYAKAYARALKWKTTSFPHFDDLSTIFGKDRAMAHNAESVFEAEKEINEAENVAQGGGITDFPDNESLVQNFDESTCRKGSKKRKIYADAVIEAMYNASKLIAAEFANSTKIIASEFVSSTRLLVAPESQKLEKKEKLMEELSKISNIDVVDKFKAAKKIADSENLMILFFGASDGENKQLVDAILSGEI